MPRLPEELINQIKQDIDLVQLIQSQGYPLKKNGKDYLLSCPWHEDTEASLVVSPDTNLWHCMGACQMGGSVIDWVMKTQGVSFRLACEILQKDISLVNNTRVIKQNTATKLNSPLAANADNQKLLHQVMDYYHDTSGFTASHLAAFKQHHIKRVLIAYDHDDAGNTAAEQLAEKLLLQGIDCFRIRFPKKMDVNDYALKMSPADKSLALVIRKAYWMSKGDAAVLTHQVKPELAIKTQKTAAKEKIIQQQAAQSKASTPLAASSSQTQNQNQTEKPVSSPIPQTAQTIEAEIKDNEIHINLGERIYRIRGLGEQITTLKINLMLRLGEAFHNDKLDLYSAKQRTVFINQASEELSIKTDVIKKDLGKLLLKLEEIQQELQTQANEKDKPTPLSEQEQKAALALLQNKNLIHIICQDFTKMGIVGEQSNTLVGYLACVSRKLDKPLAIMIQSSSAAGKSVLMEAILDFMPENECTQYSAMTGQSLFYLSENSLKHKILAISEEEGASNASYALKLLQSEGQVTIASTGKDNDSGQLVTQEYTVKGPTMLFMTTTAIDIDEELLNRCLVLSVNESREQTQAIHHIQRNRRTLKGLQKKLEQQNITQLHRNAQSLLKPIQVINPYADQLTFLSDKTRTRRDHEKYLTLIDCITLLHQYQRDVKTINHNGEELEYIEVTLSDIELANQLADEVLGRTLDDLPPQTRKLLSQIQQMVNTDCQQLKIEQSDHRFGRKAIREFTGWSDGQLKIHCKRLEEMEYLLVHRGGRGQSIEYELLYTGNLEDSSPQLMGLLDLKQLKHNYDLQKLGLKQPKSAPGQGQVRPKSGGSQTAQITLKANVSKDNLSYAEQESQNTLISDKNNSASYRSDSLLKPPPLAAKAAHPTQCQNSGLQDKAYV